MEWISVEDRLPKTHDIVEIKTKDGKQMKVYYHADQMHWLKFYNVETSHFQDMDGKFLHNVSHWRKKGC